jgi:multicomponent Na+:H+ antiporter subunit G
MDLFDLLIKTLAVISLGLGTLAIILGALGLVRLGDVYQRMHGAGIVDTGGAGLVLFGLLLLSPDWTVSVRVILIGALLVFTSPTATHAIARAAGLAGVKPVLKRAPRKASQGETAEEKS